MADRFYDGMPGPEIRQELNHAYDFMVGAMVSPTSSTTLTVGTGEQTLTVEENKALGIGQSVRIARTSDPLTWMDGVVTSYVGTTLKVLVSDTDGSGTYSDWTVTLSGAAGPRGDQGPQGPQGKQGDTGPANTLSIGTVQDGPSAGASITGAAPAQTLNLTLPKGEQGIQGIQGKTGATGPANSLSIGTVQGGATADATITGAAPTQTLNLTLPKGDTGAQGIQGIQGKQGEQGIQGLQGKQGDTGNKGWSPVPGAEADGELRLMTVVDWVGGEGTKPAITGYISPTGIVQDKKDATDVRGAPGAGAVSKVNNIDPDGGGNVTLDTDDIAEGSTNKYFSSAAAVTAIKGDADWKASDWDTAYSWGNHASAGYATQTWVGQQGYVTTDTTYSKGTQAQLTTGSSTTSKVWAAKDIAEWVQGLGYLKDTNNLSDLDDAGTALTNLGGTAIGKSLFTLPNPSGVRYLQLLTGGLYGLQTVQELQGTLGVPSEASVAELTEFSTSKYISPSKLGVASELVGISGAADITPNWETFVSAECELTATRTLNNPINVIPGTVRVIWFYGNNLTKRTVSFGNNYIGPDGDLPEISVNNATGFRAVLEVTPDDKIFIYGSEYEL